MSFNYKLVGRKFGEIFNHSKNSSKNETVIYNRLRYPYLRQCMGSKNRESRICITLHYQFW